MSLNWKEIDLLLEELDLNQSIIQKIWQYEHQSIVCAVHKNRQTSLIHLSTRRGFVRICADASLTAKQKIPNQRFIQLLKSRIVGKRITAVNHINKQRIVRITLEYQKERLYLYFKMWNNGSNIILAEENGIIIDALYRRPRSGIISGKTYNPEVDYKDALIDNSYSIREYNSGISFNDYICNEFSQQEELEKLENSRTKLVKNLERNISKCDSSIKRKTDSLQRSSKWMNLKEQGDLILSNIHLYKKNSRDMRVINFYRDNETTVIHLDPQKNAQENAEDYYEKSKKMHLQHDYTSDEISNLQKQKQNFEKYKHEAISAQSVAVIENIERFITPLIAARSREENQVGLRFDSGGFIILTGRDSKENDALLRNNVKGNDWWLHVRDYPGGYVFIKHRKNKSIPLEVLLDAGNLAIFFSKARGMDTCDLYYTQVKYLRRVKDGKRGQVIPFQEKNLRVQRDDRRLNRLLGRDTIT